MELELIADYACVVGEGPLWHPFEKRLYWTDIDTGRLFRYDPITGAHEQCYQGALVGGFTIQADGALLLFGERGGVRCWRDGAITTLIESLPGEMESRFNDVIADPMGRVYCGTMAAGDRPGTLYRLDTDGTMHRVVENVLCSNGMGFTPDGSGMYFTDSFMRDIYLYRYDRATGDLSDRKLFAHVAEETVFPDGMTVDAEGCVWSAQWDGSCAVRYDSRGREIDRIEFPVKKVSSVVFGGEEYRDLFITTAGGDQKERDGKSAGALYRARPPVGGVPEFLSRVGL